MDMANAGPDHEPFGLTAASPAQQTWEITAGIIRRISPDYDFAVLQQAFDDVMCLFEGSYPGYGAIQTLYHDQSHTLEVYLCAVRLMHGVHLSGEHMDDKSITLLCIATLMHDIGYAQRQEEACGTGAQYTGTHIERGIEFIRQYLAEHDLPQSWNEALACMLRITNPERVFDKISFPDPRTRLLAQMLGTADLVAQMADRIYLEKLLFLFLEFREANFGDYRSMYDLLCKTHGFHEYTMVKLDEDFGSIYTKLTNHFKSTLGAEKNYYMTAINKNMEYLSKVIARGEDQYQAMLRRHGITEKANRLLVTHDK
jgi:hypothetical protein